MNNYDLKSVSKANKPKAVMMKPEIRFTHILAVVLNLSRKKPTPILNVSHQRAEPMKTPITKTNAAKELRVSLAMPSPAKMTRKERIVAGLVRVRNSVEA